MNKLGLANTIGSTKPSPRPQSRPSLAVTVTKNNAGGGLTDDQQSYSPAYEVNPLAFTNENREKRSQYSHNSAEQPENGNSENNESALEQSENENRVQVTI